MVGQSIIGIVLAAGRSTRMGTVNKLTKIWQGQPLIAHVLKAAQASSLSNVVVVTGHQKEKLAKHLESDTLSVENPDFASGMASSLRVGILQALDMQADAALVLLGDMPMVTSAHIETLIAAFKDHSGSYIVQASCGGKPGNPVLFPGSLFPELLKLGGDMGARDLIKRHLDQHVLVEIGEAAARDFDTPNAFAVQDRSSTRPNIG